jgi:hypothetical protein
VLWRSSFVTAASPKIKAARDFSHAASAQI